MENAGNDAKVASLLAIIFDSNPSQRIVRQNPEYITHCMNAVITFGNAHLMQRAQNMLAVLTCHHHTTQFLYPAPGNQVLHQTDGQYEAFAKVTNDVKSRLSHIIVNAPLLEKPCESLLAGSISMALCYIARMQRNVAHGTKLSSRVLVITGSECTSQYMTYLNVYFAAKKLGITIDVCAVDKPLTVLQQGCDITGGQYLDLPQLDGLLQYLLWVFLPDPELRHKLASLPPKKVEYRAACICHRQLIDIGYVCSVCLSIYCKFSPLCITCHAVFKPPGLLVKAKKRKTT